MILATPPVRRTLRSLATGALLAAGFVTPAFARGSASVDRLLPPDTIFVFSVDDDEAYTKSLDGMPLTKIMKEEEVIAFLEKPRAAIKDALAELNKKLKEQEGFENFDLSLDQLMAGTYGRMFFAVTHIGLPSPESGSPIPDIGLVIGVERRAGAPDWQGLIKDVLGRVTAKMPKEKALHFDSVEKNGLHYEQLMGGPKEAPSVVMGSVGNLQLFSLSPATLAAVMSRASGSSQESSLADNANYQRTAKNVAIDNPAAVHFFVNVEVATKVLTEGVKFGLQQANQAEYIPMVDRILDMSGLKAVKAIGAAGESVNGVAHARAFSLIDGERKGLLAAFMPGGSIDLGRLKLAPKDSTSVGLGQLDLASIYDFALGAFKEVDEKEYTKAMDFVKQMETQIGGPDKPLDLRGDLLGNLGPEFMMISPPSNNAMTPSFLALIQVKHPDAVVDALTKLINFGATQAEGAIALKTSDYKGTTIHQVDIKEGLPIQLSPCFAVKDDMLLFSLSTGDLKRQLRAGEKSDKADADGTVKADAPKTDVTQKEDFQRFFGKVPKQGVTNLHYSDTKYVVESMYGQLTGVLPMLGMMGGDIDLPIDMNLLPQSEALTKHLFGSLSYGVRTADGELDESYGPFGGEVGGALVAGLAGAGAIVALRAAKGEMGGHSPMGEKATAPHPVEEKPEDLVRQDLGEIRAGVAIYKLQHDSAMPDRLEQLLEPSTEYPQGCIQKLPTDPWGHAYLFKKTETGYVIWSMGPDGKDDSGAGDDIAVKK